MPKRRIDTQSAVIICAVMLAGLVLLVVACQQLTHVFAVEPENPTLVFNVQDGGNQSIGSTNSTTGAPGSTLYFAINDTLTLDAYLDCSGNNWMVEIDNNGNDQYGGNDTNQVLCNTTLTTLGQHTVEASAHNGTTVGPITGTLMIMDMANATADDGNGNFSTGTVYRPLPGSGVLNVDVKAYLTDGNSTAINDESQKPYTFGWNLTYSASANATIGSDEDDLEMLSTSVEGIDMVGSYNLDAMAGSGASLRSVTIGVFNVDIDIYDFDEDGNRYEVSDSAEDTEEGGSFVLLNDDDDNDNGIMDFEEAGTVDGEDDLQKIVIRAPGLQSYSGNMTLTYPSSVNVFETSARGNVVTSGTAFSPSELEKELWIEGRAVSVQKNGVEVKITSPEGCEDTVKLTVGAITISFDADDDYDETLPDVPPALDCDFVNAVAEAENTPFYYDYVDDGGEYPLDGDDTDFSYATFSVQLEDPSIESDETEVQVILPDNESRNVSLERMSPGSSVFAAVNSCVYVTGTTPPATNSDWPLGLRNCLKFVDEAGDGGLTVKGKRAIRKSTPMKYTTRTIAYHRVQVATDESGNVVNPAYLIKGQTSTFKVEKRNGLNLNRIEWELTEHGSFR